MRIEYGRDPRSVPRLWASRGRSKIHTGPGAASRRRRTSKGSNRADDTQLSSRGRSERSVPESIPGQHTTQPGRVYAADGGPETGPADINREGPAAAGPPVRKPKSRPGRGTFSASLHGDLSARLE